VKSRVALAALRRGKKDIRIAKAFRELRSYTATARKLSMSPKGVWNAVRRLRIVRK